MSKRQDLVISGNIKIDYKHIKCLITIQSRNSMKVNRASRRSCSDTILLF